MGGNRRYGRRSRTRAVATGAVVAALALGLAACGESSSDSAETEGTYPVKVVTAQFPTEQRLGETTLLRLGVRNTGHKTIPALTMNVTIAGKEGENSRLPFGYRSAQPGLAQPDRPVWVLSARYPKANGSTESAGAETPSPKTFDFGPLKPGKTLDAVWKVSAVRTGNYRVEYGIGAGLGGKTKAETDGTGAGGSFGVRITEEPPETEVTDSGEVVEIEGKMGKGK